jgi:hypothetical protein
MSDKDRIRAENRSWPNGKIGSFVIRTVLQTGETGEFGASQFVLFSKHNRKIWGFVIHTALQTGEAGKFGASKFVLLSKQEKWENLGASQFIMLSKQEKRENLELRNSYCSPNRRSGKIWSFTIRTVLQA